MMQIINVRETRERLCAQSQPVLISHLTEVEVASTLARWVRMGELNEPEANRIESAYHAAFTHSFIEQIP